MINKIASLALACALALTSGCSESDDPNGPSTEENDKDLMKDESSVMAYTQPAPWAKMNTEQRFEFMQKVVVPEMTTLFQKQDPDAKVSCATCHGKDAGDVKFKMPNGLAPLNVADFPLDESEDPKIAASARFMREEVVPAMAGLLEVELRSEENPDGFGCFGCHARDE